MVGKFDYVVPNQATADLLTGRQYTNSIVIGNRAMADSVLAANRLVCLEQHADRFHTNKTIIYYGDYCIAAADLATEEDNDTVEYGVFHCMLNETIQVTGLAAARDLTARIQEQLLKSLGMDAYRELIYVPVE